MNNKTKKEIWEELQQYKKQVQQYEDFWQTNIIDEYQQKMIALHKFIKITSTILLLVSSFILGLCF